jgi:hypothetical protein
MSADGPAFGAVVIAGAMRSGDDASVQAMVRAARAAGANPVVVVVPRGLSLQAPIAGASLATVGANGSRIAAVRAGMALLANTSVGFVLLWPFEPGAPADAAPLRALADEARGSGAAMIAIAGAELDRSPVLVARDAWLEVMTLGEQGLEAVAARRGVRTIAL